MSRFSDPLVVELLRENGAEMSVELAHAGRGSNATPGNPALAPSDVPLNGGPLGYIKPMNEEDMAYVRQQFVDCAVRWQKAGLKIAPYIIEKLITMLVTSLFAILYLTSPRLHP